jgi:hypothetical protein
MSSQEAFMKIRSFAWISALALAPLSGASATSLPRAEAVLEAAESAAKAEAARIAAAQSLTQCEETRKADGASYRGALLDSLEAESDPAARQRLARAYMRLLDWSAGGTNSLCGADDEVLKLEAVQDYFADLERYNIAAAEFDRNFDNLEQDAARSDDPVMANLKAMAAALSAPVREGQESVRQLIHSAFARKAEIQSGARAEAHENAILRNEKKASYLLKLHAIAHGIPYPLARDLPSAH